MTDVQQAVPVAQEVATVAVTQADRDAVQAFHHVMLLRLMSDVKSQRPKLGDDEGDAGTLVQAFARHRLAALPDATQTREAELRSIRQAIENLEVRDVHIGYDSGAGGGNYVYEDYIPAREVLAIVDAALSDRDAA